MTCTEHYFENLLFDGMDVKDDWNRNALSKDVQEAVEECADYVLYSLFNGRVEFLKWVKEEEDG